LVTTEYIAEFLKKDVRTIQNYVSKEGAPREEKGQYNFEKFIRWYIDKLERELSIAKRGDESFTAANLRLTQANADLKELELATLRSDLIKLDDIKKLWERVIIAFKSKLLTLPTKLSPRLFNLQTVGEIKTILDDEVYNILNELSNTKLTSKPTQGTGTDDLPHGISSGKTHHKRVGRRKKSVKSRVKRRAGEVENKQS
jgi:phage terminase Nu1 subunit (DNA packaging protein)